MTVEKNTAQDAWKTAKADYLRAKWARERQERKVESINLKIGAAEPKDRKVLSESLKEAKSVLSERKTNEARAEKVYRDALKVWNEARIQKVAKVKADREMNLHAEDEEDPIEEIEIPAEEMPTEAVLVDGQPFPEGGSITARAKWMVAANGGSISLADAKKILKARDDREAVQSPA